MEGETSLPLYSPELAVQSEAFAPAVPLLPPVYLFHGTGDYSIPSEARYKFKTELLGTVVYFQRMETLIIKTMNRYHYRALKSRENNYLWLPSTSASSSLAATDGKNVPMV